MFFFYIPLSNGKTYYTDYGDFIFYTEDSLYENDLMYKEESIRYKWHIEERFDLGYYVDISNLNENEYVDYNNVINSEFSNWSEIIPSERYGRIIEEKKFYKYFNMEKIRYIYFSNLESNNDIIFSNIEIYSNGQKLNYTVHCDDNFFIYSFDNEYIENTLYIENNSYLRIDLGNYFYPNDLEIKLYLYDEENVPKKYKITLTKIDSIDEEIMSKEFIYNSANSLEKEKVIIHTPNDLDVVNGKFEENYIEFEEYLSPSKTLVLEEIIKYRFSDLMYTKYTFRTTYMDGYHEYLENYTKDLNDYIVIYKYKYRDKITVPDSIIINNYEFDLAQHIEATTDYEIIGDFNIYRNADYELKIIFKELEIPFTLQVSILENEKNIEENRNEKINDNKNIFDDKDNIGGHDNESKIDNKNDNNVKEDEKTNLLNEEEISENEDNNIKIEEDRYIEQIIFDGNKELMKVENVYKNREKNIVLNNIVNSEKQILPIEVGNEEIENTDKIEIGNDNILTINNQNKMNEESINNTYNRSENNENFIVLKILFLLISIISTFFLNKRSN